MKEVMAIIRPNMINQTKERLLKEGYPSMYCRKVSGRGKRKIDFGILEEFITPDLAKSSSAAMEIVEMHRLLPKRLITLVVNDSDVEKVVKAIIEVNKTGNPGDGKIFVSDVAESIRVRTGESGEAAI